MSKSSILIEKASIAHLALVIDSCVDNNLHAFEYYFNRLISRPISDMRKDQLRLLCKLYGAKKFISCLALKVVNAGLDKKTIDSILKDSISNA